MKKITPWCLAALLMVAGSTTALAASDNAVIGREYSKDGGVVEQFSRDYIGPSVAGDQVDQPIVVHDEESDEWTVTEKPAKTDGTAEKWKPSH